MDRRRVLSAGITIAAAAATGCTTTDTRHRNEDPEGKPYCPSIRAVDTRGLLLIAHHGAATVFAENTIEAFDWAVRVQGANALEIDVCYSADGQVFLWHDWDPDVIVSKLREGGHQPFDLYRPVFPEESSPWRKAVSELKYLQIQSYFGYELTANTYDREDAPPPPRKPAIPTLQEFVEWAKRQRTLKTVFLDVKMPNADKARAGEMLDAIESVLYPQGAPSLTADIVIMVPAKGVLEAMLEHPGTRLSQPPKFTWDIEFPPVAVLRPERFSAIDHAVRKQLTAASIGRPTIFTLAPWWVYARVMEYDIRRWNEVNANPETQNKGRRIEMLIAWTINEPSELECLARMGVSGVITDNIPLLRKVALSVGREIS